MIIHAPNVHNGGGKVLLKWLINANKDLKTLIVDQRLEVGDMSALSSAVEIIRVKPTIFARLKAEYILFRKSKSNETVLCFGNLPPLLPLAGVVNLFFQNTLLLKASADLPKTQKLGIKLFIERVWLKWGMRHVQRAIVQSQTMKQKFGAEFPQIDVKVWPFYLDQKTTELNPAQQTKKYDFVYVASTAAHKNHQTLFEAWRILLAENLKPSLAITLEPQDTYFLQKVTELQKLGAQIDVRMSLSHQEVMELYSASKALIYPSLTESFGLPLLEAKAVGLPIIAAELDYVREYVDPVQTFDPKSALSIARAVKRFLKVNVNAETSPLLTPAQFIEKLSRN